ncbi:Ctr copper transporter [Trinorchestia longiramus]|nr:Ctr copper transporter [Trinorchestia longiramus]
MSAHAGHNMSAHAGHDMSAHAGHDMSAHAGHDMSAHAGHVMADNNTAVTSGDMDSRHVHGHAGDHGESGHYVYTNGHGDGLLQAGVSEVLLFPWAVTDSAASLFFACLCLLLIAVALEYLRLVAWWLEVRYGAASACPKADGEDIAPCNGRKPHDETDNSKRTISELLSKDHSSYDAVDSPSSHYKKPSKIGSRYTFHLHSGSHTVVRVLTSKIDSSSISVAALGLLHTVNYIIGTCLMLITMTFNIYIITSIGIGVAVGKIATMFTKRKITGKSC